MLDIDDLILAAINVSGGMIEGRTRLQKLIYFASQMLNIDAGYRPHYYGPYSAVVAATVDSQVSRRVLQGICETFSPTASAFPGHDGEFRRYSYVLTPDGVTALKWHEQQHGEELNRAIAIMKPLKEYNTKVLCYAAKLYHILQVEEEPLTYATITLRAKELGWQMEDSDIVEGVKLLKQLSEKLNSSEPQ